MDLQHFAAVGDGGYIQRSILEKGGVGIVVYGGDELLKVTFEKAPILIAVKSKKRVPFYEERIHIRIRGITDDTNEVFRLWYGEDDPYWDRFQAQWQAFLNDEVYEHVGTQLKSVPFLNTAQVAMLAAQNIHTAEQLSSVPDSQLGVLGLGAYQLKETARRYVEIMRNVKPMQEVASLRADLNKLIAKIGGLSDVVDEDEELPSDDEEGEEPSPVKQKRKRRTKAEMETQFATQKALVGKKLKAAIAEVHATKDTIEEIE